MTTSQNQDQRQRDQHQREVREVARHEPKVPTPQQQQDEQRRQNERRGGPSYEDADQPGKHPANLPGRRLSPVEREHKTTFDLEDVTGNPGHLNINPNAPAEPLNNATGSANPPVAEQHAVMPGYLPSINEPPGSDVTPAPGPGEGEGGDGDLAPELLSIDPDVAAIGDPDVTLTCTGEDFDEASVITFNGGDEETTFVSATELTTTVKPSTATTPGEFPVTVRNQHGESEPVMFEFVEAARASTAKARPKPAPKPSKKKQKSGRR